MEQYRVTQPEVWRTQESAGGILRTGLAKNGCLLPHIFSYLRLHSIERPHRFCVFRDWSGKFDPFVGSHRCYTSYEIVGEVLVAYQRWSSRGKPPPETHTCAHTHSPCVHII